MSTNAPPEPKEPHITGAPVSSFRPAAASLDAGGPSVMRDDQPTAARVLALFGLAFVIFGGMALALHTIFGSARIGPAWSTTLLVLGLAALLFHAAFDTDTQIRRLYMVAGIAILVLGIALTVVPYPSKMGEQFRWAVPCLLLGLLFLVSFLRNEDDSAIRDIVQKILGGIGLLMAVVGLLGGNLNTDFFLPMGLILGVLGLLYITAFVGTRGISDDLGYYGALALCGLGVLIAVIALGRSLLPTDGSRFFVTSGFLFLVMGLLYVAVGALLALDWPLFVLTRRELSSFFLSPIAYLTLFGFTAISFGAYLGFVDELFLASSGRARPMVEPVVKSYIWGLFPVFINIFLPSVITMRLLSEEQRSGTLEVLLTAPVDEVTVVLSKFIAGLISFMVIWSPFGLYLITIPLLGGAVFDYRPLLSFLITLTATGAGFIAMGLFFSSLTKNQIASAVITLAGMLALTWISLNERNAETGVPYRAMSHISFLNLWYQTLEGKIVLHYLLFYPSLAVLSLFLTIKVLESRKWR